MVNSVSNLSAPLHVSLINSKHGPHSTLIDAYLIHGATARVLVVEASGGTWGRSTKMAAGLVQVGVGHLPHTADGALRQTLLTLLL